MATLTLGGIEVNISDDFLKLSPEDQQKTVDDIERSQQFQNQIRLNRQQQPLVSEVVPAQVVQPQQDVLSPPQPVSAQPQVLDILNQGPEIVQPIQTGVLANLGSRFTESISESAERISQVPSNIGDILSERGQQFDEIVAATETGEQTFAEGTLQTVGKVGLGSALDVLGEGVGVAFEFLKGVIPDEVEEGVKNVWQDAIDTDIGRQAVSAAKKGAAAYAEWVGANPRASRSLDAITNLALVATPVKVLPKVGGLGRATAVGRAGEKVLGAATAQQDKIKSDFIEELVRAKSTKKVRESEVLRSTEGGIFRERVVEPSISEKSIANAVKDVPGVERGNTLLQNLNKIDEAVGDEGDVLKSLLAAVKTKIPKEKIVAELKKVQKKLDENPVLTGNASTTGKRVLAAAQRMIAKNPKTPAGMLQARKDLDKWIKTQKPKVFNPDVESALSIAVKEVRRSMNDMVASSATDVGVKKSLSKQSNLLGAIDNIKVKAADEAGTAIGRLMKSSGSRLGLQGGLRETLIRMTGAGALLGGSALTTGLGTTAALAATVGAGVATKKAISSAAAKRAVGNLLKHSDKAMRVAKSQANFDLVKKIRADRAAVVEIFKAIDLNQTSEQ